MHMASADLQVRGFGPLASRLDSGLPVAEHLYGAVLFADLAGFTGLGEAFAESGTAGGESLHRLLDGYFAILIDRVGAAGGEVTTFAGDALAAVFDARRQGPEEAAVCALRCAVGMQDALTTYSARDAAGVGVHPHMKVGLGVGNLTRALVGDPNIRVLHVLAGMALESAVAGQRRCRQGEVLADAGLMAALPDLRPIARRGPWCVLGSESIDRGPMNAAPGGRRSRPNIQTNRPRMAARAQAQQLVDEHRPVTSVFLALPEMDVPSDGGAELQRYLNVAMPVIQRYGGDLRQVDAGDKGYQLVIGFGAPRTAADDAARAVCCCLELVRLPAVPVRAGVATGLAFCAEVGTAVRREYVVMGDSVNVAAWLAQGAAPRQVRVDGATLAHCMAFTVQRRLGPLQVKGRTVPVEAYAVEGLQETTEPRAFPASGHEVFLGRSEELTVARSAWRCADRGQGRVLLITGEPGMGKSRLVSQLATHGYGQGVARPLHDACPLGATARSHGVVVAGGGGVPGDARPYLAWRAIWRSLLFQRGQRAPLPGHVTAVLRNAGEDERAPLLGAVLGIDVPDNSFTASLKPAQRADATRALLLNCLRRLCGRSPVTLLVDDAQWLDELSQDLLTYLAGNIANLPVLMVVVARDEPSTALLLTRLRSVAPCTSVALEGLAPEEAEELVRARATGSGTLLPERFVSPIAQRSGGSPLFIEQLVSWAAEHPEGLGSEQPPELPTDVRRLVLARVDRLLPRGQATLKAASAIADDFSATSVHACLSSQASQPEVERDLRELATLELIRARPATPEVTYGFRHALVQEVVYGSLSSAARSELHEAVAEYFERAHADDLQPWVDRLAHHYGRSTNLPKQRIWFRAAGDAAARAYANEAAVRYYERLAGLLPDEPEVLVRIGAIQQLTGQWRDSEKVLRAALDGARAARNRHAEAEAQRELGLVLLRTRGFTEAMEQLRSAADAFAVLGDGAGQARALDRLAYALLEHGDYRAALDVAQEQLAVEGSRQDAAGLGAALENMALVRWRCGRYAEAMPLLRRAYALARRSGDRRLLVHTANDLAGLCAERGDQRRAVKHLREAMATAEHIGYREATAYLTGNAGELYRDHGDFDAAQRHFAAGLRAAMDVGDWLTMVFCVAGLAATAADQGAAGHRQLLQRASEIAGQLHQSYVQSDLLLRRAEAAVDARDWSGALPLAQQAEAAARRLSEHGPTLRPHLLRLRMEVATRRTTAAEASREVASMLPDWPDAPERALLLDTLAQIDSSARSHALEAAALYRELFSKAASRQYAAAYERLTGGIDGLPAAEPLPQLSEHVAYDPVDLEALFARVEEFTASATTSA
jgi:predicted ATPase/class 3 adenylate cyclase